MLVTGHRAETCDCTLVVTLDNVRIVSVDAKILLSNAAASVSRKVPGTFALQGHENAFRLH